MFKFKGIVCMTGGYAHLSEISGDVVSLHQVDHLRATMDSFSTVDGYYHFTGSRFSYHILRGSIVVHQMNAIDVLDATLVEGDPSLIGLISLLLGYRMEAELVEKSLSGSIGVKVRRDFTTGG